MVGESFISLFDRDMEDGKLFLNAPLSQLRVCLADIGLMGVELDG